MERVDPSIHTDQDVRRQLATSTVFYTGHSTPGVAFAADGGPLFQGLRLPCAAAEQILEACKPHLAPDAATQGAILRSLVLPTECADAEREGFQDLITGWQSI